MRVPVSTESCNRTKGDSCLDGMCLAKSDKGEVGSLAFRMWRVAPDHAPRSGSRGWL